MPIKINRVERDRAELSVGELELYPLLTGTVSLITSGKEGGRSHYVCPTFGFSLSNFVQTANFGLLRLIILGTLHLVARPTSLLPTWVRKTAFVQKGKHMASLWIQDEEFSRLSLDDLGATAPVSPGEEQRLVRLRVYPNNPAVRKATRAQAKCRKAIWTIENGVFRVRDVSYDEDRLHGRKIAPALSLFRNVAINLLRQEGYAYIPDGWRDLASKSDRGLHLLYKTLKH